MLRVACAFLVLLPLSAGTAPPLRIGHLVVDPSGGAIEFDVTNVSTKPIRSWTMTIGSKSRSRSRNPVWPIRTTSDAVSGVTAEPLVPNQSRHCRQAVAVPKRPAASWEDMAVFDLEPLLAEWPVEVTAALFADGSAYGDLQLLDRVVQERRARLRTWSFWRQQWREMAQAAPLYRLQAFHMHVLKYAAALPKDLIFDSAAQYESVLLGGHLAGVLRLANEANAAALTAPFESFLAERLETATKRAGVFPWPGHRYSPAEPFVAAVLDMGSFALLPVQTLERNRQRYVTVRNEYGKPIVEYHLAQGRRRTMVRIAHGTAPGAEEDLAVPPPDAGDPARVVCLVFRDRSGVGDAGVLSRANEEWRGERAEMERVISQLWRITEEPGAALGAAVNALLEELAAIPAVSPERSHEYVTRLIEARQTVRTALVERVRGRTVGEARLAMAALAERLAADF
jgi:hypothetical protein